MFEKAFGDIYTKFKLNFYKEVSSRSQKQSDSLTAMETFCMETIMALGAPTVNEFAQFLEISSPNATYKINHLVKKGYLIKKRSEDDKREYHLYVTPKYMVYYNNTNRYFQKVMGRIGERFTPEELDRFNTYLTIIKDELMTDVPDPDDEMVEELV